MPSAHKHPPIPFRPPEEDRARLLAYAQASGRAVNAILAEALREYLGKNARDASDAVSAPGAAQP